MSSTNSAQRRQEFEEGRSPTADNDCCGMGYEHKKCRSGEVKLSRTQRIRQMRRTITALQLGQVALQTLDIRRLPLTAASARLRRAHQATHGSPERSSS